LLGKQNAQSPLPWEQGKNTKLPAHLRQSHPPLQRGKLRLSPLQGREACAPPAQRARKIALPHSVEQAKRTISPPLKARENTKLPAHLRQVKQQSHPPLQRRKPRLSSPQVRRVCALPAQRAKKLHSSLSKGRELHAPGWGPFLVSPSSTCFKYFKHHSGHVCHFAELIYARLYLIVCITLHIYFFKEYFINKELLLLHCSWFIFKKNNAVLVFCYVCEYGNKFYLLCLCNEEPFTLDFGKSYLLQSAYTYHNLTNKRN
ncbi:hypothetical protein T4B_6444, partial [Trichinella pseudospiralis]